MPIWDAEIQGSGAYYFFVCFVFCLRLFGLLVFFCFFVGFLFDVLFVFLVGCFFVFVFLVVFFGVLMVSCSLFCLFVFLVVFVVFVYWLFLVNICFFNTKSGLVDGQWLQSSFQYMWCLMYYWYCGMFNTWDFQYIHGFFGRFSPSRWSSVPVVLCTALLRHSSSVHCIFCGQKSVQKSNQKSGPQSWHADHVSKPHCSLVIILNKIWAMIWLTAQIGKAISGTLLLFSQILELFVCFLSVPRVKSIQSSLRRPYQPPCWDNYNCGLGNPRARYYLTNP